jgi:hypothetical protein
MDVPEFLRGGRMLRFHTPFDGKRFIGDRKKMVFHDSLHESTPGREGGCQIDRIASEDGRFLSRQPRRSDNARLRCGECLWTESCSPE